TGHEINELSKTGKVGYLYHLKWGKGRVDSELVAHFQLCPCLGTSLDHYAVPFFCQRRRQLCLRSLPVVREICEEQYCQIDVHTQGGDQLGGRRALRNCGFSHGHVPFIAVWSAPCVQRGLPAAS